MTKDQFSVLLSSIQSAELQVREDGQKEYAHDDSNVFAKFDRVAEALKLDRKQVLLVYALKHWDGIVSYVGDHKSQREDLRGRIKDLRMYLALLWGMVEEESSWQDPIPYRIWRDNSDPSFTADHPNGKHAAWYFTFENKDYGPYFTRRDAEKAAFTLAVK